MNEIKREKKINEEFGSKQNAPFSIIEIGERGMILTVLIRVQCVDFHIKRLFTCHARAYNVFNKIATCTHVCANFY